MVPKLLTRSDFRERVFERSKGKCVFCGADAVDAHHLLERRLFPDGGYYLDNGIAVCEHHHLLCERTVISVEEARLAGGIHRKVVPPHLYGDQPYDKWGNPILPNKTRLRGELFADASVQKVLAEGGALELFTPWVKFPRTYHLPWSEGITGDERELETLAAFEGERVIVTLKMDGENTTMYPDHVHARSVDSRSHPSQSWVRQFWSTIANEIPEGWRLCGENLYAKHSIHYRDLETYFMGFSVWNDRNVALTWDQTVEWFDLLGVQSVPVLYDGIFDPVELKQIWARLNPATAEGYVVRVADEIGYGEYRKKVAKFVRRGHVNTVQHWRYGQPVVPNLLASGEPTA